MQSRLMQQRSFHVVRFTLKFVVCCRRCPKIRIWATVSEKNCRPNKLYTMFVRQLSFQKMSARYSTVYTGSGGSLVVSQNSSKMLQRFQRHEVVESNANYHWVAVIYLRHGKLVPELTGSWCPARDIGGSDVDVEARIPWQRAVWWTAASMTMGLDRTYHAHRFIFSFIF